VRVLRPQQLIELRPDIWIPDQEGLGWRQQGGLDTTVNTGERTVRLVTGEHGHRISPQRSPIAPAVRVLTLGDSFLVGLQVDYADLFSARLEKALALSLASSVEVVNTGVGGWGPSHYLLEARSELAEGTVDAVLVALFAGNDIEVDAVGRFNPRQGTVVHAWRWPTALRRDELVTTLAYPLNDTLERRSHAFVLARAVAWKQLMRLGLSARRLPTVLLRSEAESPRWATTADTVAKIVALAAQNGAATVVVLIPGAYQVDPELAAAYARGIGVDPGQLDVDQPARLLGAELAARGIPLLDLLPALRAARGQELYGRVDTHLAPAGHEVVARELVEPLVQAMRAEVEPSTPPTAGGLHRPYATQSAAPESAQ
jgi:hypothetical protein